MRRSPPVTLGKAILYHRHLNGMTQLDLGIAVGLSRQSILDIESGKTNPRWNYVWRIAQHLNMSLDALTLE